MDLPSWLLSRNHGLGAIFVEAVIGVFTVQTKFQPIGKVFLHTSCRFFCPGTYLDEMTNGSLSSLLLAKQDGLVDHIRNISPQIRVQNSGLFRSQRIPWVEEESHGLLQQVKKLGVRRGPRSELLRGKSQGRGNALVTIFRVADQLDKLEPEEGKMQMSILIQNLVP